MTAPATTAPVVIAQPGEYICGDRYLAQGGIRCERAAGHDGGHLSSLGTYWQAAS